MEQAAAGNHRRAVRRDDDIPVHDQSPGDFMADDLWLTRRKADCTAIDRDHGIRNTPAAGKASMFLHMTPLPMHRDRDGWFDPAVHVLKLRPAGMTRYMDVRLPVGDHFNAGRRQLVLDHADGYFVPRDLLGGINHQITDAHLDLMLPPRDPRQRGIGFTLRPGADDQQFVGIGPGCLVKGQGRRKIGQIADAFGDPQNTVERAARDDDLAPGVLRNFAQRVQPGGVGRKCGDQDATLATGDDLVETFADAGFRAGGFGVEHIGRVADQGQNALRTDGRQFSRRRVRTHHRGFIQLPVAGVEQFAIGRLDQQRIAFGDRVRQRDIGEFERSEIKAAFLGDDVQLDLVRHTFLIQFMADQASGERCCIERNTQVSRKVRDRADMILMAVSQHDSEQILGPVLDETEVGQHQINTGVVRVGEGHTEVDHHPFAVATIEIDVHSDLSRTTKRQEDQFIFWFHLNSLFLLVKRMYERKPTNCQVTVDPVNHIRVPLKKSGKTTGGNNCHRAAML